MTDLANKIAPEAEEFLHGRLYEVVYQYITTDNCQRLFDSFRGSLDVFYFLEQLPLKHYMFLTNFIRWLECRGDFENADDDLYSIFYDSFIKDLNKHYDKEGIMDKTEIEKRVAEIDAGEADLQEHELIEDDEPNEHSLLEHLKSEQWEYKHAYIALFPPSKDKDPGGEIQSQMLQDELNKYGADGWELVSVSPGLLNLDYVDGYAVFKRKL